MWTVHVKYFPWMALWAQEQNVAEIVSVTMTTIYLIVRGIPYFYKDDAQSSLYMYKIDKSDLSYCPQKLSDPNTLSYHTRNIDKMIEILFEQQTRKLAVLKFYAF